MKHKFFATIAAATSLAMCQAEEIPKAEIPAGNRPKIQFDRVVYDFGSTSLVKQLTGVFNIVNTGTAPLILGKPTTTCGCTIAALKLDKLAPGEKTELSFTLAVGNTLRGPMEKHITVPSNDPKNANAQLTVKTDIVPVFDYDPQMLDVGNVHLGVTTNFVIQIKRTDGKPMGITKVEANGVYLHPYLEPVANQPNTVALRVEIVADGAARRFNNVVNVMGADDDRPLFTITVSGRIVGDLVIQPQQLVWGIPNPESWPGQKGTDAAVRRILVSPGAAGQKLEINNISCTVAEVKVHLNPSADGKTFEVVAVIDKVPKESVSGVIRFETNFPRQPIAEIPLTINVYRHN
ncbi:MAG: DUF1573 domain-containing protein [Verrucomicrobiota bacterium]